MNTELFTLSRVFTESLYRIPDYQRGYSWKEEHLKDFWLDIDQLEQDKRHYTGVLTLEIVPDEIWSNWQDDAWIIRSRKYRPYYVVDGQQRLTTAVILLQCILEATSSDALNYTPIDHIRRKYIFDSKPEHMARSYLFGYEKDNPSYEFLKRQIYCENSDHHSPDEDTIYTKNLENAKKFFTSALSRLKTPEIELIFTKLTQQLVFNVYEIASDIDVFVSFETMNNRGKPLSTLELLKNRLIFLSTKIPASEPENGATLRRAINDAWKTTYHYLGKNEDRPLDDDIFLRTNLAYYFPTKLVKGSDILEQGDEKSSRRYHLALEHFNRFLLNDLFTPKRLRAGKDELPTLSRPFIYEYSQQLKSSVETFYKLSTPSDSTYSNEEKILLERLGRLNGYSPSPILIAVYILEKDVRKRLSFLNQFERLNFCYSLFSRTGVSQFRRRSLVPNFYVEYISGKSTLQDIVTQFENAVNELFKEVPPSEALYEWVKNGPSYYGWRFIKYFLFEYELHLQTQTKADRQKLNWKDFAAEDFQDDYETIEHIYPQKARHKYWSDRFGTYTTTQRRLLRNSLGNLLPLSRPRNSSLGNRAFPDKLGDEASMTGYRYGSYSEIDVAQSTDWTAEHIVERGIRLLSFLETRWKIVLGDRSQKLKALGLSFLDDAKRKAR